MLTVQSQEVFTLLIGGQIQRCLPSLKVKEIVVDNTIIRLQCVNIRYSHNRLRGGLFQVRLRGVARYHCDPCLPPP